MIMGARSSKLGCWGGFFLSLFTKYVIDRIGFYNYLILGKAPFGLSLSMLQFINIYARGRANLLFPARLKPQK